METMERFLAGYIQEIIRNYPQDRDGQRFQQEYFQYISSGELSFSYRWCILTYNVGMFFKVNRRRDYAEQVFKYLIDVYDRKLHDQTECAQYIGLAGEAYDSLASLYYDEKDMIKALPMLTMAMECYKEAMPKNKKYMLKGTEIGYGFGLILQEIGNYIEAEKAMKNAVLNFRNCMNVPEFDRSQIVVGLLKVLNSLGTLYYNRKKVSEAWNCHSEAAKVFTEAQKAGLVTDMAMSVMADVYGNMGNEYADFGDSASARMYYNAALSFCDALENRMPFISQTRRLIQRNMATLR